MSEELGVPCFLQFRLRPCAVCASGVSMFLLLFCLTFFLPYFAFADNFRSRHYKRPACRRRTCISVCCWHFKARVLQSAAEAPVVVLRQGVGESRSKQPGPGNRERPNLTTTSTDQPAHASVLVCPRSNVFTGPISSPGTPPKTLCRLPFCLAQQSLDSRGDHDNRMWAVLAGRSRSRAESYSDACSEGTNQPEWRETIGDGLQWPQPLCRHRRQIQTPHSLASGVALSRLDGLTPKQPS
ncbi:hypothetical protein B0T16DRAFT_45103 [Cercophora newfieldiana]|uniref:Transmembrane protein n=1 Tax=Cercophora newfieldiana TaxID=92897 RepID=A0AA39YQJ2_9PEZI|nr:hypothetical protein B0T16DRAFT_45103 [Cercophora newfieldiana]